MRRKKLAKAASSQESPCVLAAAFVLFLIVLIAYSNSFQSGWVLDNTFIVKMDPRNKEASAENLKLLWTRDYWWPKMQSGAYRPLVSTSYLVNWSVFGNGRNAAESDQVIGFHWVNLITHAINALLVYLLTWRVLRRRWVSFISAALFAAHPIATESVTNIIGRADEFMMLSFLGSTLLYIRSTEASGLARAMWLVGATIMFAVGCFSKESALAFLGVPVLFDVIFRWNTDKYREHRRRNALLDFCGYCVLTLPVLGLLYMRSVVFPDPPLQRFPFLDNPITRLDWNGANSLAINIRNWFAGFLTAANVGAKGLWKLLWPASLSSDYSYNQIKLFDWSFSTSEDVKAVLSVLLIGGTLAVAAWCFRRHKPVSFFILLYWIAYSPTSNFVVSAGSIMAERFLYVPSFAFCALLVLGIDALSRRRWPRFALRALVFVIMVLYGVRTYVRNFDWRNDVTLAESALKASPRSFRSFGKLAEAYYQADPLKNVDRIIELGKQGIEIIDPLPNQENGSVSYLALGTYYGLKGERTATRTDDGYLVMSDRTKEWFEKSALVLERGVEIDLEANAVNRAERGELGNSEIADIGAPELYLYLGMAYARLGLDAKALEAFKYKRHLDPREPDTYGKIALREYALGNTNEAVIALTQCVILDAQRQDAWQALTDIYAGIGSASVPEIEIVEGRPYLREDNPLVRQYLFHAHAGLMTIAWASKQHDLLDEARTLAVNRYHFDPTSLDRAAYDGSEPPRPPAPIFHTVGKKLFEESLDKPTP